jgi:hypothetical protein
MCTYLTEKTPVEGSGKGAQGYFSLTEAMVYIDHPQHAPQEHTVNIDFLNPGQGPSARIAVELTEESALALVEAVRTALASAPPGIAAAGHQPAAARSHPQDAPRPARPAPTGRRGAPHAGTGPCGPAAALRRCARQTRTSPPETGRGPPPHG